MANSIKYTGKSAKSFVNPTSRYAESRVVYYTDNNFITFETYKKTEYVPSLQDQVSVIPPNMQYRPDLVSRQKYGTVDFWWKIMEVNGIKDIYDFTAGRTILLPGNTYAT